MTMTVMLVVIAAAFVIFTVMNVLGGSRHPFSKSIFTMASGVAALVAVNLLSPLTSVSLTVSGVSVLAALVGGIPGVSLMLLLDTFF